MSTNGIYDLKKKFCYLMIQKFYDLARHMKICLYDPKTHNVNETKEEKIIKKLNIKKIQSLDLIREEIPHIANN